MFIRYRIKSRFRFTVFMIIVFILLLSVNSIIFGYQAESMTKPTYNEIRVIQGDTLWELAKTYGPDDQDIRKIVHQICKINDITADELRSGQTILIPEYL